MWEYVQCCQHSSLSGIMMSQLENGASLTQGPMGTSYVQYHAWGPHLLLLRKAATKVVKPKSDRGSRNTDVD